jgi:hypothetical protein
MIESIKLLSCVLLPLLKKIKYYEKIITIIYTINHGIV